MKNNSFSLLKFLCFIFCMVFTQLLSAHNMIVSAPNATFKTADITSPALVSSLPTDDATNMTLSENIVLNFNDKIVAVSGNITIRLVNDNSIFEQMPIGDARISISDSMVTINPTANLLKGTDYYIEIDASALDDDDGNSFIGISGNSILNFTTVDVVINEVVTEPQQDWSISSFLSAPGGSPGTNDEWVELLINSNGIDFTGWTIELDDSTPVIGDLTNTGAFEVVNYVGSGNFNITNAGDYLVLCNVRGAINNSITIKLKDPGGATVDEVIFGTSPLPSGNSDTIFNESAQRFINGIDNDSNSDWTQGQATIGAENSGPSVTLTVSAPTIIEALGTSTITATLSAACSEDVTVNIGTNASSTATGGGIDYSLLTSIVIAAGDLTGSQTLTAVQDTKDEVDETVIIDITGVTNGTEAGSQQQTITITDDDLPPTIAFNSLTSNGLESVASADLQVDLSAESGKDVTVNYTVTGTATGNGIDYTLADGILTITAGYTNNDITISSIIGDVIDEVDETVIVTLSSPGNATLGTNTTHTYTITDDDPTPTVAFNTTTSNGLESVTSADLQVDLSAMSGLEVKVDYAVTGTALGSGTDYTLANGTLIITAEDADKNITIASIVNDLLDENNETVIVTLSNPTNATLGTNTVHTYTITDDDATPTVYFNSTASNGDESVASKRLQVDLSAASGLVVTVDYAVTGTATGGGTDYTLANGTLTISALSANDDITIANIVDDLLDENNETVVVTLSNPFNASLVTDTVHTYTINDNDVIPDVTTLSVLNLQPESVQGRGFVNSLGSPNPTAHGVCWSQSTQPTVANNHTDEGEISETGNFTSEVTSLAPGTQYYLRAYITNTVGTSYGDEESFTTLTLPIAKCQDTTVFLNSEGMVTIDSSYINDNSSATAGIQSISLDFYDFSCVKIGDNIVELTVADVLGYTSSCIANVLVKDTISPEVSCNSITVTLYSNGEYVLNENDLGEIAEGTTDNCTSFENLEIDVFPRSFECVHVGELIDVKVTVYDESGNNANCWTTVTVLDETPPVALCKDLNLMLDENGEARIYPTMVNGGDETITLSGGAITKNDLTSSSYDACGVSVISIDKHNFDCSDIGENTVTLTVFDAHGNNATCESIVVVSDIIAPVIEPIADVELKIETGSCESFIEYPEIVVNDNCETVLELINGIGSDGIFPVGIATETWKATDVAGNSTIVSFDVIVTSSNAMPTIDAVNDLSVNEGTYSVIVDLSGISYGNDCEEQDFTVYVTGTNSALVTSVLTYTDGDNSGSLELLIAPEMTGEAGIVVLVEDEEGGIITETFTVTVVPVNDAPFVVMPIPDQTVHASYVLKVPISPVLGDIFDDIDNSSLDIEVLPEGGGAFPAWITLIGDTLVCTPAITDTSCVNIVVTATDAGELSVSDTFEVCADGYPVSIGDLGSNQFEVQMYPNPTRGEVNINISSGIYEVELSVLDITGKIVLRKQYSAAENITFDMSGKVSGTYFVHLNTGDNQVVKKLVVDKK